MPFNRHTFDYEPVTRSSRTALLEGENAITADWSTRVSTSVASNTTQAETLTPTIPAKPANIILRRGHTISYIGLFLFTSVLYFRPYELFTALSSFTSMAFWTAVFTLSVFIPSQLALEGTLTTRPREVNLLLLLCVAGLLSIPLAISPVEALITFYDPFIKVVLMFIVLVNVVRTERRLKGLFFLALAVSCVLSLGALNDYRLGRFTVEGYRVSGIIGAMFGNPNDMALHLVTITPIVIALFLSTRSIFKKMLYSACAALLVAGVAVTFSRSGFLGLVSVGAVLAWKLGRHNRLLIAVLIFASTVAFFALASEGYTHRLVSIFDPGRDAVGSASARRELLFRSIYVALKNPLLGIGMGNFHIVSIREQVSHNAYTQVASEMGFAALVLYTTFIVTPLKRLRQIERETFATRRRSHFYYLAIGLQASLIAYMVSSFFASVAYQWYVYYLVGYAVCLRRIYNVAGGTTKGILSVKDRCASDSAKASATHDETTTGTSHYPQVHASR